MARDQVVFLFDVDNTLLDNDRVVVDLRQHLQASIGKECERRYFSIFEDLRSEVGYADYLGALQRYRVEHPHDLRLLAVSLFLTNYPFANRLFPNSLDVLDRVKQWGNRRHPLRRRCGFPAAQGPSGRVYTTPWIGMCLFKLHKEQELNEVERLFPAEHYVLVDDKLRLLAATKQAWGTQVTTVFPN